MTAVAFGGLVQLLLAGVAIRSEMRTRSLCGCTRELGVPSVMIPTINSYRLSQHIPTTQLIIYPDAGHGSLFQDPELFLAHVKTFLAQDPRR